MSVETGIGATIALTPGTSASVSSLNQRETVEAVESEVGGRPAERTVVRGKADGAEVAVEAVVLKGKRCVYDFVYVAPADAFEAGRGDFRAFVESFAEAMR